MFLSHHVAEYYPQINIAEETSPLIFLWSVFAEMRLSLAWGAYATRLSIS